MFDVIVVFDLGLLVVSFGVDMWEGDLILYFVLMMFDYVIFVCDIVDCGWLIVILMEGGYVVDVLGVNVVSFLDGF